MIDDLTKAFGCEKAGSAVKAYFKIIEELVENIMKHKFDKEELSTYFLIELLLVI